MTNHSIDPHWDDCPNRETDPERRRLCTHCANLDHEEATDAAYRTEPADDPQHGGPQLDM